MTHYQKAIAKGMKALAKKQAKLHLFLYSQEFYALPQVDKFYLRQQHKLNNMLLNNYRSHCRSIMTEEELISVGLADIIRKPKALKHEETVPQAPTDPDAESANTEATE
ncbi:MAG: hypothetical protein LUD72_10270 [Bacteroidales bacterium]|nr:hypothetical protein [Bacteroidales bacterium]